MRLFKKFSLIFLSAFIFVLCPFIFAGCKDENKNTKLYVFATVGGYVQVDNHEEIVEFGDEGSKIFTYKKNDKVRLKAIANDGYHFVKWQFTDALAKDYYSLINNDEIEISVYENEVVVKAQFEIDDVVSNYTVSYPSNTTGYTFTLESGYSTNVVAGGDFKFKVTLWEDYSNSDIVIKANDEVQTPDNNGIYTISNINSNVVIIVEGVELNQTEEPIVPTPTTYQVFTQNSKFIIVPVGQDSCEVEEGGSILFTIQLTDSDKYKFNDTIIVKANGDVLVDDNGKYAINDISQDVEITVEGIELITYKISTQDTKFTIIPVNQTSLEVEKGSSFTFKIEPVSGYKFGDSVVVKANKTVLTLINDEYIVEAIQCDIEITVEGIVEDIKVETYTFALDFEEGVKTLYPELLADMPKNITITISENEKQNSYIASQFTVLDEDGFEISIKDIIDIVEKHYIVSPVSQFMLGEFAFIVVDGDNISINWNVLEIEDLTQSLMIIM
ncbi:MAG: hypothetical protein IJ458_00805 [Clostridia bacterium]|nr:hypothetical protein [Clostridia bacterium]